MAEEGKKISFGFAKSMKKPVLKSTVVKEEKKVDYIECLEEKGIKIIGGEEEKEGPLIIPLLGSRTWHDRIFNKIDADIFEPKVEKIKTEPSNDATEENKSLNVVNGNLSAGDAPLVKVKVEPGDNGENVTGSLEDQAAKEIIEELNSNEKNKGEKKVLTLPMKDEQSLRGEEQSTLDDYEKIPVDAFGLAMLRGMGWQPGKGLGKNEKLITTTIPELRPKGMGLGADKVASKKQNTDAKKPEEELKIEKGTFVKIIAGKQSNNYGQIEGLDDDAGRLIIKLALGGNSISINEFMAQPVTKSEYLKNSKVLNAKKFEEYKDKAVKEHKGRESKSKNTLSDEDSESSETDDKSNTEEKRRKTSTDKRSSKPRKRHSDSNDDSSSDYGKKARKRNRSSSSENYKSKKSKKHRRKDGSPERSSRKHKKKDKEREKTRDKKSRDSEHTDKRKHKKRARSRSRSSDDRR